MKSKFELPEKWCVDRRGDTEICEWFNKNKPHPNQDDQANFHTYLNGWLTHWPPYGSNSCSGEICEPGYTMITPTQFHLWQTSPPENTTEDLSYLAEMFTTLNIN